ncbi:MAG: hypothetical protein ACLFNM_02280 [Candidatus Woesearchaeota archaeon]
MHVAKIHIQGNSLVGLYIVPTNDVVLVGQEVPQSLDATLEEVFGAPVVRFTVAGASLIGIFLATDGETLLVPNILFAHEKEILKKQNIPFMEIDTLHTCLGNNLIFHKNGLILMPDYEDKVIKQLQSLNKPIHKKAFGEHNSIGSVFVANSKHGLVTHDISQEDFDFLQKNLSIQLMTGTVNMGSVHIKSGIAVTDKGFVIGDHSGGPEIVNADEALGFQKS